MMKWKSSLDCGYFGAAHMERWPTVDIYMQGLNAIGSYRTSKIPPNTKTVTNILRCRTG